MISLDAKVLSLIGRTLPITHNEVWWASPIGIFETLDQAKNLFPDGLQNEVRAVPVAVNRDADGRIVHYEVYP